jgi:hypothetical protein
MLSYLLLFKLALYPNSMCFAAGIRVFETEENTHRVGENICRLHIRQRLTTRIYRELKKLNPPKINEPINRQVN